MLGKISVIQSLLIVNRGEIACRIMRTSLQLGIHAVAVNSDFDAEALQVQHAAALAAPISDRPALGVFGM